MRSGLLDEEFYAALRGQEFPDAHTAAEDCVAQGMPQRLSPHPFLDFTLMPPEVRRAWRLGRVPALLRHLDSGEGRSAPTGPLHRPGESGSPSYASDREHLVRLAGAIGAAAAYPPAAAAVDWDRLDRLVDQRVPGRVSVVIPTFADAWMTVRAARSVLDLADGHDIEVVVVDNGSPAHVSLRLGAGAARTSGASWSGCRRTSISLEHQCRHRGVDGRVPVVPQQRHCGASRLAQASADGAGGSGRRRRAQPLLLYEDDTIQSAGTVFVSDGLLPATCCGHPPEDGAAPRGALRKPHRPVRC